MIECSLDVKTKTTKPIAGQKPGTSGLRKKTKVFMEENYLANFVQSVFDALADTGTPVKGGTLVVSGDGRYFNLKAAQIVAKIAYGNGVKTVWFGVGALLSTPAVSAVIRSRGSGFEPFGGFILSASHNPGGPDEDFGIKYNCENGGPAPEKVTNAVHAHTGKIQRILECDGIPDIDLSAPGAYSFGSADNFVTAEVFDSAETHEAVLRDCFDFPAIKSLIARPDFTFVYDCMNGVQGPYAKRILVETLGGDTSSILNGESMEDFGGKSSPHHGHADPNLTYAKALVAKMGLDSTGQKLAVDPAGVPEFGAAADGDADRNMILGKQFFISPSDSLAMICANADVIPYFARGGGLKGVARSMPTSLAVDLVAKEKGIPCFETPTGWKFFGNLMDSGDEKYFPGKQVYTPFLCGEESFGTGSDHVREKDGMWAVLAWLQILASKNVGTEKLVTVEDIAVEHWAKYGRNYYARYDYEGVDKAAAEKMMDNMRAKLSSTTELGGEAVALADDFTYVDPVDGSTTTKQGIRVLFKSGSRFVFRLSGTGVEGATVRLYLEKYEEPSGELDKYVLDLVKPLAALALSFSDLAAMTGRTEPSVIT